MKNKTNFTQLQQAYVDARIAGHNITRSAEIAGYSPAGADRQGSALEKRGDIKRAINAGKRSAGGKPSKSADRDEPRMKDKYPSSLVLLQHTYNNSLMPDSVRLRAAEQALPYEHGRVGETGKKQRDKDAADKISKGNEGKFKTKAPPGSNVTPITAGKRG